MRKITYIWTIAIGFVSNVCALEFGQMGNLSASMGGAGVALKDSPWGLYYNPALLGADNRIKFGYSVSMGIKTNKAIIDLIAKGASSLVEAERTFRNNDFNSMLSLGPTTSTQALATTAMMLGATSSASSSSQSQGSSGKGILGQLGLNSKDEANNFLKQVTGGKITDSSQLKDADNDTLDNVRGSILHKLDQASGEKGVDSSLLKNALQNIQKENLGTFLDKVSSGGSIDSKGLLQSMGGSITFKKSDNPNVAKLLDGVDLLLQILKHANVKSNAYVGANLQIGLGNYGGIAIGYFGSASLSTGVLLDNTHSSLIIQNGSDYYLAEGSGDKIRFSLSSNDKYESSSILSNKAVHTIYANSILLSEIPLGYGKSIYTPLGNISLGAAFKYMHMIHYGFTKKGSIDTISPNMNLSNARMSDNFGVDAGILWDPFKNFSIGLVGKNLNSPRFKSMSVSDFIVDPQLRAGVGYKIGKITMAFDADLLKNKTTTPFEYAKFVGGGILFNFKLIDFRIGAMKNLDSVSGEGVILTAGANLLGLIDVALQSGTDLSELKLGHRRIKLPSYFQISFGGGFSF